MTTCDKANELLRELIHQRIPVIGDGNVITIRGKDGSAIRLGCYCHHTKLGCTIVEAFCFDSSGARKNTTYDHSWGGTVKPMTVVRWVLKQLEKLS